MANGDTAPWTITGQTEDQQQDASGVYVAGVTVRFRTAAGNTGSVFVPRRDYRADVVRQMVGGHAAMMDEVAALRG